MLASSIIRQCRVDAGLTLRGLAERAGTSHATLAAYEAGRKVPTVSTLDRIVRAAGYALDVSLAPRMRSSLVGATRGEELAAVLELAEAFPARHARSLDAPVFPRR